ncbi:hypothetical protein BH23VER1_BH23VER1_10800 [soil metagenome]
MRPIHILTLAPAVFAVVSCQAINPKPTYEAPAPHAVAPIRFLYNDYKPFNEWLDTPAHIIIEDVPLNDIFASPILQPMNYRLTNMPIENPEVNINSIGMTRRQLLWSLSHEYGLRMTPKYTGPDFPSFVEITGKDRSTS